MYESKGIKFYDQGNKREMMLVLEGDWHNWLVYKHPDGQWVTLRKATEEDIKLLDKAAVRFIAMSHTMAFTVPCKVLNGSEPDPSIELSDGAIEPIKMGIEG